MKFIHLADLHLGKRVNGFSMLEDQAHILNQIIRIADSERPDAVLIAGDVYDRSIPSEDAVELFDDFLVRLSKLGTKVFIISGNHDSAERVSFGARLMDASGIHFAPVYDGVIRPYLLEDSFGQLAIWPIPFLKPAHVRRFFPDSEISSYSDAMKAVISALPLNPAIRNVSLVHQFISGASVCDSEEHSVGGIDQIPAELFASFDYVALGHLHGPQYVSRETVRYSGSPLKYSFSEADQRKSVTIVEAGEKGCVSIRTEALTPLRDLRRMAGDFEALMSSTPSGDYLELTLTDEEDVPNALARLRTRFPNLMSLKYDNTRTRSRNDISGAEHAERKSPIQLFDELYALQNGQPMTDEQKHYVNSLIEEIWEVQA